MNSFSDATEMLSVQNDAGLSDDRTFFGRLQMKLRQMKEQDIDVIENWRPYPQEFKDLDYALRNAGWISQFRNKKGARIFTAEENGAVIGFTILSKEDASGYEAEFRIALSPVMLGQGMGRKLARATLEKGFLHHGLCRIYLIVRKNNHRAQRLYEHLGFRYCGECQKEIQGRMVELFEMALEKENFEGRMRHESESEPSGTAGHRCAE